MLALFQTANSSLFIVVGVADVILPTLFELVTEMEFNIDEGSLLLALAERLNDRSVFELYDSHSAYFMISFLIDNHLLESFFL
jgi:hypothetical protein